MTSGVAWCPVSHMRVKSVSDLWRDMVSRKSHVNELKNWIPKHSKKKPSVGIELRAGGDLHRSKKPGWSAGDTGQRPQKNA